MAQNLRRRTLGPDFGGRFHTMLVIVFLAALAILYLHLAPFDPFYRTIFVEEMNSGEAGRAAALSGDWHGEGGRWQSAPASPAGTAFNWLAFKLGGIDKVSLRFGYAGMAILGVSLLAMVLRRTAPDKPWLVLLTVVALGLSPFMLHLLPTAVNEVLFIPCIGATLAMLTVRGGVTNWNRKYLGLAGLAVICSLAVFVKADGVILPLAVSLMLLVAWLGRRIRFSHFAVFLATGLAVAASYVVLLYVWIGADRLMEMRALIAEINSTNPNMTPSLALRVERTLVWFPKNLELYLPGAALVTGFAAALALSVYRRIDDATRVALFILIGYFLMSLAFPLVYWKRLLVIVPSTLLVLLAVARLKPQPGASRAQRVWAASLAVISVLWGAIAIASEFRGMWRIIPSWQLDHGTLAIVAGGIAAGIAFIIVLVGRQRSLLHLALIGVCLTSAASGVLTLAKPRSTQATLVGQEIASLVGANLVVADHQAFRFFGYYSTAKVRFTHENDPGFPESIFENVRAMEPQFIAVSRAYRFPADRVFSEFPDYEHVRTFTYEFPSSIFLDQPYQVEILVFERNSES